MRFVRLPGSPLSARGLSADRNDRIGKPVCLDSPRSNRVFLKKAGLFVIADVPIHIGLPIALYSTQVAQ
jgi:hypothetical protein